MTRSHEKVARSYIVRWKNKTNPVIEASGWQPGYSAGHAESPEMALAHAMARVLEETAIVREKWIKLQLLVESERTKQTAETMLKAADAIETLVNAAYPSGVEIKSDEDQAGEA